MESCASSRKEERRTKRGCVVMVTPAGSYGKNVYVVMVEGRRAVEWEGRSTNPQPPGVLYL